jgi:TonB family protein
MQRGLSERARSLALLGVLACLCAGQPIHAADDDDEEPADLGSYDGSQTRTQFERPEISIERPELQSDFQIDLAVPTTNTTLPTLNLTDALVAPTPPQATASPPPTSSPARQTAQQSGLRETPPPVSAPPQQRAPSPPPPSSQPASQPAASAGPRIVPISMEAPSYPQEARRDGAVGFVTVAFTIRVDGTVDDVEVVEDRPRGVFRRATQRAVRRWRFEPIMINGRATEYRVQHRIDFNLDD